MLSENVSRESHPPDYREFTVRQKRFIALLLGWLALSTGMITALTLPSRTGRAVLGMGWGLIVLWVFVGGALMHRHRRVLAARADYYIRGTWRQRFVVFCTLLALIEEAITTSMTNLAPLFGVRVGEAYITASTNYLDVVGLHSVIVFIPMFVAWAFLLGRFAFTPFQAALLFGITGTLAECTFGPQHLLEFGLWIPVYGLMVYLPAYSIPERPGVAAPRWWHFPLAVIMPFPFVALFPVAFVLRWLFFPNHPDIHFPPIR